MRGHMLPQLCGLLLTASAAVCSAASPPPRPPAPGTPPPPPATCTPESAEYDYVVVGSGPGGGPLAANLARAGHKTLLIEAGDDESADPDTNVASFFKTTGIKDNLHWDFFVKHYDDMERTLKFSHLVWKLPNGDMWVGPGGSQPEGAEVLGVHYPRGATLGGSSIINAGAVLLPSDSDWNHVRELTGDDSWSAEKMRSFFTKIEKNNYVPEGTPGHNTDGYLEVTIGDGNQYLASEQAVDVLNGMVEEMGEDPSKLFGDWQAVGLVEGYSGIELLKPGSQSKGDIEAAQANNETTIIGNGAAVATVRETARRYTGGWWVGPRMSPRIHIMKRSSSI